MEVAQNGVTYIVDRSGKRHNLTIENKTLPRALDLLQEWRYTHFGSTLLLQKLRNARLDLRIEDQKHWFISSNPEAAKPDYWNAVPVKDVSGRLHIIYRNERMSNDVHTAWAQWNITMRNICNTLFGQGTWSKIPNPFPVKEVPEQDLNSNFRPLISATTELDTFDYDYDNLYGLKLGFEGPFSGDTTIES